MPITGSSEVTTNPNAPDTGSTSPDAIVPTQALVLSNGNTLLGWTDFSGSAPRMMLQLFDPAGTALGAAFTVAASLGNATYFASAVATADGGFYVQRLTSGGEGLDFLHYTSTGELVGQSQEMSSFGSPFDAGFRMSALPGGGLAVFGIKVFSYPNGDGTSTYVDKPVLFMFDSAGNQISETVIEGVVENSSGSIHADITVLPGGNIVATWVEPLLSSGGPASLHTQVFNSSGTAVTSASTIDSGDASFGGLAIDSIEPVTEAFADGSFVAVWFRNAGNTFQIFNADGTAQGPAIVLHSDFGVGLFSPGSYDVVTLPDGTFVIGGEAYSWTNPDTSGQSVVAMQFNRDGTRVNFEFITLNSTYEGDQGSLDLVATGDGGFTAVWLDRGEIVDPNGPSDAVLDVWRHRSFSTGTVTNTAPVAQDGSASGTEDAPITGQVAATDADGNALTYSLVTGPAHGTITFNANGSYTYTPGSDYNGADSFTFRASDGTANSNVASVLLAIAAVNDAPVLAAPISDVTTGEDAAFSFTLPAGTFTDVDNAALALSVSGLPAWLSFDAATRTFSGTPANGDVGTFNVIVTASDGSLSVSDVFAITVANVNDAPTVAIALVDQAASEDTAFTFTLPAGTFTDVDAGDTLALSASGMPAWLSFDAATRTFSGTPANGDVGTFNVTVTASDGRLNTADVFAITVANVNDAPTVAVAIVDQAATQGTPFSFALPAGSFADQDAGDTLSLGVSSLPAWLSFDPATGAFTGTPGTGDVGLVSITVTATDLAGAAVSDTFVINVATSGTPPITGTNGNNVIVGTGGNDVIFALGGDDAVFGLGGNDTIDGGTGNDFLMGGGGSDRLLGDAGNDLLFGGDGNDSLLGGTGNDLLSGGSGADALFGDAGADQLEGGSGADRLTGGAGADRLDGGSGADVFVYTSVLDSAPGGGNRDRIVDFARGTDRIDLAAIDANTALDGDQAFTFIGNGAFSGAAGQLRYVNGIVSGDINGDGIADFQIQLQFSGGGGPLAGTDFFL
ncbi:MAG: putative Ig domain-containing protein [Novosphingobium sp.]|uniref:putative Ig domain-containing protein n=1 Tax=Novosphingobium sp. TaxID=1874826 RepID=UPI0032B7BCFD